MRVAVRVFVGVAVDVGVPVRLCAAPGTTMHSSPSTTINLVAMVRVLRDVRMREGRDCGLRAPNEEGRP